MGSIARVRFALTSVGSTPPFSGNSSTVLSQPVDTRTSYDYTLPMMIFAGFGVLSIVFALLLRREDRIKGYGLERPNIEERSAS